VIVAPVLQCPDCGQKHPVEGENQAPAFRCDGCGRMLKVPPQLLPSAPEPPPPSHFPPRRVAPPLRQAGPRGTELPRLARFAIWIVAVPLGFLIVFEGARIFGLLSQRQVENVFLLPGWNRFWPVARLLPIWALVTTLIVHFGNIGIERWRARRQANPGGGRRRGLSKRRRNTTLTGAPSGVAPPRNSPDAEAPTQTSRVS
jgi:hypothetical protein